MRDFVLDILFRCGVLLNLLLDILVRCGVVSGNVVVRVFGVVF